MGRPAQPPRVYAAAPSGKIVLRKGLRLSNPAFHSPPVAIPPTPLTPHPGDSLVSMRAATRRGCVRKACRRGGGGCSYRCEAGTETQTTCTCSPQHRKRPFPLPPPLPLFLLLLPPSCGSPQRDGVEGDATFATLYPGIPRLTVVNLNLVFLDLTSFASTFN